MKNFKRIVGFLLCLAMVLSIVPASIFPTTVKAATTTTSDILEKIDLTGTAVGGCSQNNAADIEDLIWWNETDGNTDWKKHEKVVDGSTSNPSEFSSSGSSERADWYLDLSGTSEGYTAVDQLVLYADCDEHSVASSTKVVFILEDGNPWEETFSSADWDAEKTLTYTFDDTINATGMYVWQVNNTYACLGEIELYQYIEVTYLDTATLNGVDIGQYKIVYSDDDLDYAKTAAEYIQKQILLRTGRQVEIVEDNTAETTYEIQVGNVNRDYAESISAPDETAMKFTFASNGTKIAMKADYFIIAGAAYYFVETYIGTTSFTNTVPTGARQVTPITEKANNYIILIGDGMGVSQTEMFEYYDITDPDEYDQEQNMSDGEDIFYGYYFPYEGRSRTWNVLNETTDSGAGGTALATGYKTYNQHIGQGSEILGYEEVYDEGEYQDVPVCQEVESLTELALRLGKSAAVMSTEETWGATPSAFSAHNYNRYNYEDIWDDQDVLREQGVIFVDHDLYLNQFTAEEWEEAEPRYRAALEQVAQDPDGFFLMYEEAYIDKECHNNRPDLAYVPMVRFNQAIGMFMEFAMYNPDTMVLITADHETGGLAVVDGSLECTELTPNSSKFNHTMMEVPVFAYGEDAAGFATDIVDPHDYYSEENEFYHNTSIARTYAYLMSDGEIDDFGDTQFPILTSDYEPEPEDPNAPKLSALSGLATPEFGYYSNNNTSGTLTSYVNSSYPASQLVDGDHSNQTHSQYYTYAEVTSGAKVPAIVFDLGGEKDVAAVEIDTYKATYYGIDDFDIQVYSNGTWTTVKSVTGAFGNKTHGQACAAERYQFDAVTGTKVRILVTKLSDMTQYGDEDAQMAEGSYIRLKEVTIYEDLNAGASTEPTQPTTPPATGPYERNEVQLELSTPTFGYYSNNNTNGAITDYYDAEDGPANLIDGICDQKGNRTISGYYRYDEITSGAKIPVILFNFGESVKLTSIDVYGYAYSYYNMEDFDVEVYTNGRWVKVGQATDAFRDDARLEVQVTTPLKITFDTIYEATALRILVKDITRMTGDGSIGDDEFADGSYIRVKEIKIYNDPNAPVEPEDIQLDAPTGLTATAITDSSITVSANTTTGGTLMFSINGNDWYEADVNGSYTFTGLDRNTSYTVDAMYVGAEGYADSGITTITVTTLQTQLSNPSGLKETAKTDSSITVTANTTTGGTLMFSINGNDWYEADVNGSYTFTGLDRNTTYTVEAKYVAADGYLDSNVNTIQVTTAKTQLSNPTGLTATETTATSITVTANSVAGGTLQFRINSGNWQTSGTFTGLDNNTTYTVDAMYVAADGYISSGIASLMVSTTKPPVINDGEYAELEAIPENAVTPHVGYNNYYTHAMYAENTINGDNINDAMYGTSAQIKGDNVTFTREDLQGERRLSVVYDLNNGVTKIGGVELTGVDGYNITKFLIQVKNGTNEWQTVRIVTANPFTDSDTVLFTFNPVEGDKVRIMIEDYEENANNAPEIREMVVYEAKSDAAQVKLPVTSAQTNAVDGNKTTTVKENQIVLTLSEAAKVKRVKLFGYTEADSVGAYTVELLKGGSVVATVTGNAYGNARAFSTAIAVMDQYYAADQVRVTVNGAAVPEIEVYGTLDAPNTPQDPPLDAVDPAPSTVPAKPDVQSPVATQAQTQAATIPTEPAGMQQPTVAAPNVGGETAADPTVAAPNVPDESGDPVAPTAPVVTQPAAVMGWLDEVPESQMTPHNGYYINGDMNTLTDEYASEAAYLNDAYYETGSYVRGTSSSTSGKVPATVFDLHGAKTIGGLTLVGKAEEHIQTFDIEYYSTTTNKWEPGVSVTSDPFTENSTQTFLFAEPVECTQVRVLVKSFKGSNPMLQELEVLEFKTGTALVKIPLQNPEANKSANDGGSVENFADGDRYTRYDVHYNALPVELSATLATGSGIPTTVSRVKLYSHRKLSSGAPNKVVIELKVNGSWIEVYNGTAYTTSSTDTWFVDLPQAYAATEICVTVSSRTGEKTMGMADIEVFGPGESYITSGGAGGTYTPGTAGYEKIPLSKNNLLGACSTNSESQSNPFNMNWWFSGFPNNTDKSWDNWFDSDYTNEAHWGISSNERGDFLLDLSNGGSGTAVDRIQVSSSTYSGYKTPTSYQIVMLLTDGSQVTKTFATGWSNSTAKGTIYTYDLDKTYMVTKMYVWANENTPDTEVVFGQFELYVNKTVTLDAPTVSWTSKNDTSITVTAKKLDASIGTLKFRLLDNAGNVVVDWQTSTDGTYTFKNLKGSTTYKAEAMYDATAAGYNDSASGYSDNITTEASPVTSFTVSGTTNAGATVKLYKDGNVVQTTTANGGSYSFSNVSIGAYTVAVTLNGYHPKTQVITVDKNLTVSAINLTQATYTVRGTTNAGAAVQLYKGGNPVGGMETTAGNDGSYTFSNVPIGTYTVVVTLNGYYGDTAEVIVNDDVTAPAITLTKAAYTVSGTITGSTADTVTVQLYQNGVAKYTATVTPNGNNATYSFTNIPIGNYSLMVTKANHIAKSATVTVDKDLADQNFTLTYMEPITSEVYTDAVVLAGYNIHLVEPWALRINLTFYTEKNGTAIDLSTFKSYGAYAIIAGEYGNGVPTTWQDIVNSPNATQFRMGDGTGAYDIYQKNATTAVFDFYDGLYTYRMAENIYWVAYYEDAAGNIHFTSVLKPVVIEKIDEIIGNSTSESEVRLLNSMKELHSALIAFRGEDADLGKDYTNANGILTDARTLPAGNTTDYQFGKSHRIRLIEPWGVMASFQVKPRSGSVYTDVDFDNAEDYGVIFYYDEGCKYNGDMTAAQILSRNVVYVHSKNDGNVTLEDGKMVAIFDKNIVTSELDTDVYCLPFVKVGGTYYYSKNAFCVNLLDEMYYFHNKAGLKNEEQITFRKMIELYENTLLHLDK